MLMLTEEMIHKLPVGTLVQIEDHDGMMGVSLRRKHSTTPSYYDWIDAKFRRPHNTQHLPWNWASTPYLRLTVSSLSTVPNMFTPEQIDAMPLNTVVTCGYLKDVAVGFKTQGYWYVLKGPSRQAALLSTSQLLKRTNVRFTTNQVYAGPVW